MQRVLVTGGAGFLGTTLTRHLLADGRRVTVVDRLGDERLRRNAAALGGAELVVADLADIDLAALLSSHDAVVHLAGTPGVQTSWAGGFRRHLDDNLAVTQQLLEAALRSRVRRVVLASSSSVYGDMSHGRCDESRQLAPLSPYGSTKAAMELLAGAYAARGVPVTSLRYFTVHGRRQRPDMAVARLLDAATGGPPFPLRGDGSQVRDLTHVDDVARATVSAVDADLAAGTSLNVGGGSPTSLRDLVELVGRVVGREVPTVRVPAAPGDPAVTTSDTTLAERLLGWRPRTSLADGIADQLAHTAREVTRAA